MPRLAVVYHSASGSTSRLVEAAVEGAADPAIAESTGVEIDVRVLSALDAGADDVLSANGFVCRPGYLNQ